MIHFLSMDNTHQNIYYMCIIKMNCITGTSNQYSRCNITCMYLCLGKNVTRTCYMSGSLISSRSCNSWPMLSPHRACLCNLLHNLCYKMSKWCLWADSHDNWKFYIGFNNDLLLSYKLNVLLSMLSMCRYLRIMNSL